MKKLVVAILVLIGVIAIASTIFLSKLDDIIADTIRTQGTATLGAKVDVGSVETKLKEGSATISDLTIANPPGYDAQHALLVDNFVAEVDYKNQTINKIVIDQPTINAEVIDSNKNNFQDLLDAMPAIAEESPADNDAEALELTIKELQINRGQVNLTNEQIGQHAFVMDNFVINNLSGTVDDISNQLITRLTDHVSTQVSDYAKQEITDMAKERAKEELKEELNEQLDDDLKNKLKALDLEIF